jgi:hypothetical protein
MFVLWFMYHLHPWCGNAFQSRAPWHQTFKQSLPVAGVASALLAWAAALSVATAQSPVAVGDALVLWQCDPSTQRQAWDYGNGTGDAFSISVRGCESCDPL